VVSADHSHAFVFAGYPSRANPLFHLVDTQDGTDGAPYTPLLYGNGPGYRPRSNETDSQTSQPKYQQVAAVPLDSETHAGEDVAIYAQGPWAHLFQVDFVIRPTISDMNY
jgi:alkaline phosphatase